ncbi:MAG TPA: helix-turn-helix transcriptional regulator [Methanobacterium sp.]|nr:helix-turn-helix transcriptional regulator [Methanobacterium sp.]
MKNKLKVYRAMHNITQEELANELGVTRQTIIAIEKNKYDPSLALAFKLADFFEASIEDIFIYENLSMKTENKQFEDQN